MGARNYAFFFSLVVTGTCQMLYQTLTGVLYMTLWRGGAAAAPDRFSYTLCIFFAFTYIILSYTMQWEKCGVVLHVDFVLQLCIPGFDTCVRVFDGVSPLSVAVGAGWHL